MDIKQLRALLAIADTGSVSRAAEALHIVQPAVSRQLRMLEEHLGAALFSRGRRGMELTEAGQILVEHARRALRELDQAAAEIAPVPGTVTGAVTIGLLPSTADLLAAPLVISLKRQYPRLSVRIATGYAGYLQKWLEAGEVDVVMLYDPKPSAALETEPLLDEVLYLVGPAGADLDPSRPVPLAFVENKPMILPSLPHGLRLLIDKACEEQGIPLTIAAETNAMNVQKNLVMNGLGYTLLPSVAVAEDLASKLLTAAPITQPDLDRRIVLGRRANSSPSVAIRCAANELRTQIKAVVDQGKWPGARWLG
ncbi:LysR family transcriptional regulator [Lacisediminimonas profundi]|uniref:LysR family transcriptional regulator n=1 Tax=Lacisediminimonas profundi TaxID=2603856 RepID=UPI00124AF5C6|nr:LysR family transcriptional regulator [Lacisediminimonas profundi]